MFFSLLSPKYVRLEPKKQLRNKSKISDFFVVGLWFKSDIFWAKYCKLKKHVMQIK